MCDICKTILIRTFCIYSFIMLSGITLFFNNHCYLGITVMCIPSMYIYYHYILWKYRIWLN